MFPNFGNGNGKIVPVDVLSHAHSIGLIEMNQEELTIKTTGKRRYFIRRFQEEK